MKKLVAVLACYSLLLTLLVPLSHAQKTNIAQQKKEAAERATKPVETATVNLDDAVNSKQAGKSPSSSQVVVAPPTAKDSSGKGLNPRPLNFLGSLSDLLGAGAAKASTQQVPKGIAQSIVSSGQGVAGNSTADPHDASGPVYKSVPPLTQAQAETMAEEMNEANPVIRTPKGSGAKVLSTPIDPPTSPVSPVTLPAANIVNTPLKANASEPQSQATNDFVYSTVRDIPTSAAAQRSTVGEPSVGNMGNTIFYTGNWYAARSSDGGATFNYVTPFSTFPSVNGGFCCDQIANYAPAQDMMLWGLQYIKDSNSGTLRLARAVGSTSLMNNQWRYYDFNPQNFGFDSGTWMDFPGMTISSNYVYLSSNVYNNNDRNVGSVVWRVLLSELAAGGTINYNYFKRTTDYSPRLTEGAGTTMYWATHTSTSQLRIFHWDDGPGNIFWDDVSINPYVDLAREGVARSPDGTNWAARADSRILGAWVAKGVIGFMWGAKQDATFPYPYTIVARFNQSTRAIISQNQIWSSQYAWLIPTASVNGAGNLAGLLAYGGGPYYPGANIWISDDVQDGFTPLALYGATASNTGPTRNSWGDYHTVHPSKDNPNTWVASTYYMQDGGDDVNTVPRYLSFGRERDFGCSFSISPTSQSFGSNGGTGSITATASTPSCSRTATSEASWLTITSGGSDTGSGTINYSVAANSSSASRTGTMTIAGRSFTVTQSGSTCSFSISPTGNSVAASGASSSVSVTTAAGCNWTANSNVGWMSITSGISGSGNGTVNYTVSNNTANASRSGTLTIAGQSFNVTQAAAAGGGSCTLMPISLGQTVNGVLSTSDCKLSDSSYYDGYTFSASSGQQIVITMSSTSFDTFLFLLAPNGSVLTTNDDGDGGTNSRIPPGSGAFSLPTTGTYTIFANSFAPNTIGSYTLSLTSGTQCAAANINLGQTVNGALTTSNCKLSDGSYYNTYAFNGSAGQQVAITMSSSTFDTFLILIAPDGSVLEVDDDGGGGTNSRIPQGAGTIILPTTGKYNILANSYAPSVTGAYTLSLSGSSAAHHKKTAGVFRPSNGIVYLKNSNTAGFSDIDLIYGIAGDQPITGDWNGDGVDTLGIYRNGTFYLRNSNTTGPANIVFAFGAQGDQPVAGDWNGDGTDTIGVYRPSTGVFYLRNSNTAGPADLSFVLGNPGDVGIAGDWNGDGTTTTGVFRPSNGIIYLKNTNVSGFADIYLVYGNAGDKPLAGDWDGDGIDSVGIYRNGLFYLRNSNTQGFADMVFALGNNGDVPIAGDWDGLP
jgi:hypothetical protein